MRSCLNCGKPLSQGIKVCPSCGARAAVRQLPKREYAAALETGEKNKQKLRKPVNKLPWLGALIALLIGGTVMAVIMLNKSPKELFLLSEYKAYKQVKAEFDERYGESVAFSKKMAEQPSVTNYTIEAGMEGTGLLPSHEAATVGEMLKGAEMTAKAERDPQKKAGNYHVALHLDQEKALDLTFIHTDKQMAVKVPALYSKFFYLNLNEYGEFMRKSDPAYAGPEKLELSTLNWSDFELKEEEKNYLTERYVTFLAGRLKEENFTLEKGVPYTFKGESMKLRKVTLSLSPEETKSLLTSYIDQLIKDKKLHNMIALRAEKAGKAGAAELNKKALTREEIKVEIVNRLSREKESLRHTKFPDGFSAALWIDKKERIIERTIKLTTAHPSSGETAWTVQTKNVPYKQDRHMKEFTLKAVPADDQMKGTVFQIKNDRTEKSGKQTENMHVLLQRNAGGKKEAVRFKMKSEFNGDPQEKQTVNRTFKLHSEGEAAHEILSAMSGEIRQERHTDSAQKYSNEKLNAKVTVGEESTLSFKVNAKTKLVDQVSIPSFSKGEPDSVDANRITDAEMLQIQQEVGFNMMSLMNRLGFFGGMSAPPLADDPQVEDLYEEDRTAEEIFKDQSPEHSGAAF